MNKRLGVVCSVLLFVFLSLAVSAATPLSKFVLDEQAPDLASAQGYTYRYYADGTLTGVVIAMTCTGTVAPFTCTAPIPAFTPGNHTVTFTAANAAGESAQSAVLSFTFVVIPAVPTNPRIG